MKAGHCPHCMTSLPTCGCRRVVIEVVYKNGHMTGEAITAFVRGVLGVNASNVRMATDMKARGEP